VSKTFEAQKFKALTIDDTVISVWEERNRLHICLSRKDNDKTMVEWWDDNARQAIEDGFLCTRDAILGRLGSNPCQGGSLHRSAFDYWDAHFRHKRKN
jgi:hypothetical protein